MCCFVDGPEVPVFEGDGVRVRVVVGASGEMRGKIAPPGDITFLDVKLEPGAAFEQAFASDYSVLAHVIEGTVLVGERGQKLGALDAASFAVDGEGVLLRATSERAQIVLIAGRPLGERVVSHGPFVMNSEQEIEKAIERFRAGGMGRLERSM